MRIAARCQELGDIVDAPIPQANACIAGEVRRNPVIEFTALQFLLGFVGAEGILGRVAGAAVTKAIDEVGAPIPLR